MFFKQLFAKKSLETLHAEAAGDNRLRRILGPINLTSLGVGAIIGAGIFVMTGRSAALDAGPAILLSFVVAGVGCLFAALCYAEFAALAPVAGSAYTYAYATLGELLAWIIGWDLILEYAMACACVAAAWSKYLNELLYVLFSWQIPEYLCNDPFSTPGAWFNLPALFITLLVTVILVIGIRESATSNAVLVAVKVGVVLFVIAVGAMFVNPANWTSIPPTERIYPEDVTTIPDLAKEQAKEENAGEDRVLQLAAELRGWNRVERKRKELEHKNTPAAEIDEELNKLRLSLAKSTVPDKQAKYTQKVAEKKLNQAQMERLMKHAKDTDAYLPSPNSPDEALVPKLYVKVQEQAPHNATDKWGMLGYLGINSWLESIDDRIRSPFMPYGLAGIVFGASIVFFAYIGFDAVSTHSEEAKKPQRDVPFAILASLVVCTILYMAVAAVLTGMVPYFDISPDAAVAYAFTLKGLEEDNNLLLWSSALISIGALAGMTSVLLITFLSQARIFLAMARDRLLPPAVFGAIHPRFRTPHISTMLTGGIIAVVSAITPILKLEEMVNIGTLMAFVIVCAAVMLLRMQRPEASRPFRTPLIWIVGPFGIAVNMVMMLFLPLDTWIRLVVWLVVGLVIYFGYGMWRSTVRQHLLGRPVAPIGTGGHFDSPYPAPGDAIIGGKEPGITKS